jgi:cell division septation protein DedD
MADKNLHDIKIDELDSPKKTPLKNILTLLALLFIILVISVVITKLILNTEESTSIENNDSKSEILTSIKDENKTSDTKKDDKKDDVPSLSSAITERNLTSVIKAPLSAHEPKEMRTYKTPKKSNTPTETKKETKKATVVKKTTTPAKKEYIDKVVVKKNTTTSYSTKSATYLGGQQKAVSNSYYIKVGTYRNSTTIVSKIKKNNFNYSLVKVENDKTLTRVLVGPFFSRNQANAQLAKVKENILTGAYVTKAK